MKSFIKDQKKWLVWAVVIFLGVCLLEVWQKYDFCQGWGEEYAARAKQFRLQAENPVLTVEEQKEYMMAADWHEVISEKFLSSARTPWRSYPSFPLITSEQKQRISSRY